MDFAHGCMFHRPYTNVWRMGNTTIANLVYCLIHFSLASTGDKNVSAIFYETLRSSEAYAATSACDDCNFSFKLSHNYLFVLVGLKFVRVVQLDTYYAMTSDVEHHV